MSTVMEFNYDVELILAYGEEQLNISDMVKAIILNFDYDNKNMPEIYIQIALSSSQYSTVVSHKSDGNMMFTLYKYDATSKSHIKRKYISNNFTYMMTSDPNYNESINSGSNQTFSRNNNDAALEATSYFSGYIALLKEESVNDNKQLSNSIIKNSNLMSIIHKYTKHMQMVIEQLPPQNNIIIDQLIIPPLSTITNILSYLNNLYTFYPSGYRYFRDFDKTYLISNNGIGINLHDGSYSRILINICDPLEAIESGRALEVDDENKSYVINVDANSTSINIAQNLDKSYNSIIAVDSSGNTSKNDIDVFSHSNSTEKIQVMRVQNGNLSSATESKSYVESSGVVLTITKANVDSSILTPIKEYIVKNYKNNKEYNGKYVLAYKKEVLVRDGNYVISTMFGLRKVSDS